MECPRCGGSTGTLTHLDEAFECGDPGLSCFPLAHWVCASCAAESGVEVVLEEEADEGLEAAQPNPADAEVPDDEWPEDGDDEDEDPEGEDNEDPEDAGEDPDLGDAGEE